MYNPFIGDPVYLTSTEDVSSVIHGEYHANYLRFRKNESHQMSPRDGTYIKPEAVSNYMEVGNEIDETALFDPNANMNRVFPCPRPGQASNSYPVEDIQSIYDVNPPSGRNIPTNIEYIEPSGEQVERIDPTASGSGDYFDTIEDEQDTIPTPGTITPIDDIHNTSKHGTEQIPLAKIVNNKFLVNSESPEPYVPSNEYVEETALETDRSLHQDDGSNFD